MTPRDPTPSGTPALGFGFVGASTVAHEHMVAAVRAAGHEVVAVCSGSAERAAAFAAAHGIAHATDRLDVLLANPAVQAVYISSTNPQHAAQACAAAAAGKPVLCEKPLATSLANASAMRAACASAGVLLATNHHLRNAATLRTLRDALHGGAIGRPLFARIQHAVYLREVVQGWRIHDTDGGGPILDIVVHDVDALRFVLGREVRHVQAMAQQGGLAQAGLEDGVMAVLRLEGGLLAQVHAAYTTRHAVTAFELYGEHGTLLAEDCLTVRAAGRVLLRNASGEQALPVEHQNLYSRGVALFAAAVAGQGAPAATGDDGWRSLAGALAVAEAARSGATVTVPAPDGCDSISTPQEETSPS